MANEVDESAIMPVNITGSEVGPVVPGLDVPPDDGSESAVGPLNQPEPSLPPPSIEPIPTHTPTPTPTPVTQPRVGVVSSTRKVLPTKTELELAEAQNELLERQKTLINKKAEYDQEKAVEQEVLTAGKKLIDADYQESLDKVQKKAEGQYNAANQEMQRQYNAIKNSDIKDFWEDKGTGSKILGGLAIALGAMGQAFTGGQNMAMNIINKAIDDDYRVQKARIDFKRQALQDAGRLSDKARETLAFETAALDNKKAAAYDVTESKFKEALAKKGATQITNEQQKMLLELDQKKNEAALKREEGLRSVVTSQTSPVNVQKRSESENKARIFAARMEESNEIFDELEKKGYNKANVADAATLFALYKNPAAGLGLPEKKREQTLKQLQAEVNFLTAVLRPESGAAISAEEYESARKNYFPDVGATPDLIEQKRRNRKLVEIGWKGIGGIPPDQSARQAIGATEERISRPRSQQPLQKTTQQRKPQQGDQPPPQQKKAPYGNIISRDGKTYKWVGGDKYQEVK